MPPATVRQLSERDRALWQTVPYLALRALPARFERDAVRFELACAQGLWPVGTDDAMFLAYVDCATGTIVRADNPRRPASDRTIARLVQTGAVLDVRLVIAELTRHIEAQVPNARQSAWRQETAREVGLSSLRPFTREAPGSEGVG